MIDDLTYLRMMLRYDLRVVDRDHLPLSFFASADDTEHPATLAIRVWRCLPWYKRLWYTLFNAPRADS